MEIGREPNWSKWQNVPEIELWEAVALSLNIDPSKIKDRPIGGIHIFADVQEFEDRLFVAKRNVGPGKSLTIAVINAMAPANTLVPIPIFVSWALSMQWEMPEQLASLASTDSRLSEFDQHSPTYPRELDIALQAWRAVSKSEEKGKPKARLRAWLNANTTLSNEAKERIATVANWDKLGGATRTE
jgi:hypothetical protein